MGRIADAEEAYKKGVALRPDNWDGYNTLGNFYDPQGKYAEAIAQYRACRATNSRQCCRLHQI